MLNSFPFSVAVGSILGFLAGLGVGGGSLLMIWLTLVLNISHSTARNINLLFFIPTALISSQFKSKQGSLNYKKLLPAILAGMFSAAAATLFGRKLNVSLLKKSFGVLLLLTGIRELTYRPRKDK